MHIGYCRVSTDKQSASLEAQRQQLKKAGCELIYEDEDESGSKRNRPQLNKALEHIRKGDTLIVCKLDRLTRSLVDLLDILKKLENSGASFRSLGETFETESRCWAHDDEHGWLLCAVRTRDHRGTHQPRFSTRKG